MNEDIEQTILDVSQEEIMCCNYSKAIYFNTFLHRKLLYI